MNPVKNITSGALECGEADRASCCNSVSVSEFHYKAEVVAARD